MANLIEEDEMEVPEYVLPPAVDYKQKKNDTNKLITLLRKKNTDKALQFYNGDYNKFDMLDVLAKLCNDNLIDKIKFFFEKLMNGQSFPYDMESITVQSNFKKWTLETLQTIFEYMVIKKLPSLGAEIAEKYMKDQCEGLLSTLLYNPNETMLNWLWETYQDYIKDYDVIGTISDSILNSSLGRDDALLLEWVDGKFSFEFSEELYNRSVFFNAFGYAKWIINNYPDKITCEKLVKDLHQIFKEYQTEYMTGEEWRLGTHYDMSYPALDFLKDVMTLKGYPMKFNYSMDTIFLTEKSCMSRWLSKSYPYRYKINVVEHLLADDEYEYEIIGEYENLMDDTKYVKSDEELSCEVCMEDKIFFIKNECKHVLCRDCHVKVPSCPYCLKHFGEYIKVRK